MGKREEVEQKWRTCPYCLWKLWVLLCVVAPLRRRRNSKDGGEWDAKERETVKVDLPTPRRPMSFVVGGKKGNDFFSGCHGFRRLSSYLPLCYLLPFVSRSLQPNTTTHFFLLFPIFFQRNSISPTEREKYRNARSPMSSGDPHAPDMKKIKREDKDGHVRIYTLLYGHCSFRDT